MLNVTVFTHPEVVHVRVARWPSGARYPEVLVELDLPREDEQRGREILAIALLAVVERLRSEHPSS